MPKRTFPRLTLFVPGRATDRATWATRLRATGLTLGKTALTGLPFTSEAEWVANDGAFGDAFSFGTVSDRQRQAIDRAPGALVLSLHVDLIEGHDAIATLARALEASGGLAIRIEQSKLGFVIDEWRSLIESGPQGWYRASVVVLRERALLRSCGMHAFSLPDVDCPLGAGATFLDSLNVYQVAERPLLRSGHTFAPDADTPRRVLVRWPDTNYPSTHPCHNPYGRWRVSAKGARAWKVGDQTIVFLPSLSAVLLAAEGKAERPLTEGEVLRLTKKSACLVMKVSDAIALEQARGYADLEPTLAWEQWRALRAAHGPD